MCLKEEITTMGTTMKYEGYWGVDVSKGWVDIAIEGTVTRVEQEESALKKFISEHKAQGILCVLESTGGYEKTITKCLRGEGITVHIAHPNKVFAFAKARGRLAKTDAIDARMLADYGRFIR
jgi:transposase